MSAALARILLVEPQFVLRRTIVAVSRDMGVADVQEATSIDAALPLLLTRRFDGIVIDIGRSDKALELLARLRSGALASPADTPVIALTDAADCAPDGRLAVYRVLCTIGRPFKVADLLSVLQSITTPGAAGSSEAVPVSRRPATQPA